MTGEDDYPLGDVQEQPRPTRRPWSNGGPIYAPVVKNGLWRVSSGGLVANARNWRALDEGGAKAKHMEWAFGDIPDDALGRRLWWSVYRLLKVTCLEKTLRDYKDARFPRRILLQLEAEQDESTGEGW